jgi:hypothetical protein
VQIFGVCTVEPTWLSELAPHFYTFKDASMKKATEEEGGAGGEEKQERGRKQPRLA